MVSPRGQYPALKSPGLQSRPFFDSVSTRSRSKNPICLATVRNQRFLSYRTRGRFDPTRRSLAPCLLDVDGLVWLADKPEAFAQWLAAAQGDIPQAGIIGEIHDKADSRSVVVNFGSGRSYASCRVWKGVGIFLPERRDRRAS
ncbi:protein of unknown function [Methylocaldum szegediense]|uniref:CobW C-terminal domain-containing protein n=1 Tax=Methylocaldum szegediense TaxID=73780 RepID=A0ABN8X4A1_9GAMM|nr:protein of unknown function [Methylocaldum szegediense]